MAQSWVAGLCLIAAISGILVGFHYGETRGKRTEVTTVIETVSYPAAWANTCFEMIDTAQGLSRPAALD